METCDISSKDCYGYYSKCKQVKVETKSSEFNFHFFSPNQESGRTFHKQEQKFLRQANIGEQIPSVTFL